MSDEPIATIEATIAGDWRIVAGILTADLFRIGPDGERGPKPNTAPLIRGVAHITVYASEGIGVVAAEIALRPVDSATIIQIRTRADAAADWRRRITFVAEAVASVTAFETWERPAAENVIESYYRRRAAGSRITLRQLAQESGFSYGYLRTIKGAYDKAGRWGAKKKMSEPDIKTKR